MNNLVSTNPSIQKAISLCGAKTISRLEEFYQLSCKLENDYKRDALVFIESVLRIQSGAETKRDLTLLLLDLGFKKSNVSKMIEATRFTLQLEREKSDASAWVKSLPVSTQYILSTCEDKTFTTVWALESEWGAKPITKAQVEQLKLKHDAASKSFPRETSSTHTKHMPPFQTRIARAIELLSDDPEIVAFLTTRLVRASG
jgi:hypothetical protein